MKKKIVSVLVCAVMTAGLLAGCSGSDATNGTVETDAATQAATEAAQEAETEVPAAEVTEGTETAAEDMQSAEDSSDISGEITIWDWNDAYENKIYPEFQKAYPNIKVNYVTVAHGDYMQKLQSAIATGTDVPDIILGEGAWRGKLFDMDILDNLEAEPYNIDRDDMFDYLHEGMSNFRDEIIGVDQSIAPAGFAYKRDLAKEYLGTDDPAEVYEMISTWDKFIETGKEVLEKSDGKVKMLAGFGDVLYATRLQNCAAYIDGNEIDITSRMQTPLETAVKVRNAGILDDNELDTPSWNAEFAESDCIFFPSAPWSCEWHVAANDPEGSGNWALTKATESGYTKGGTSVSIYKDSPNKEAAFAYLKWVYFSVEGSIVSRDQIGQYSSLKECYEGESAIFNEPGAYDEFFGGQNLAQYYVEEIIPNIKATQRETAYETIVTQVFNKLNPTLATDTSIDAAKALEMYKEEISIAAVDADVK